MAIKLNFSEDANFKGGTPEGDYDLVISSVSPIKISDESTGSLPPGTPGMAVEFTVQGPRYAGMKETVRYYFVPDDHPKKSVMDGIFGRFLVTCGYDEQTLKSGEFELEPDELVGMEFTGHIGPQKKNPDFNEVTRLKARADGESVADKTETASAVW